MSALNLREQILAASDLKISTVHVEQWNLDITVRELNAGQRDEVISLHSKSDPMTAVYRTITLGAIDEEGNQVFEEGDAEKLAEKSDSALGKIYKEIIKLSGLGAGEESEAGKPSEKNQDSGTTTDSCTSSESELTKS